MIHVLLDCTCILPKQSGVGRYATELLRQLLLLDADVKFTILLHPSIKPFINKLLPFINLEEVKYIFFETPGIGLRRELKFLFGKKKLPEHDVFHCMTSNAPLALSEKGIVTIHDLKFILFPEFFGKVGKLKSIYLDYHFSKIAKHYARIITVSNSTRNDFINRYQNARPDIQKLVVPIYSGYNELDRGLNVSLNDKYEIDRPYLFYLGELRPHKNIKGMIEAFLAYKAKNPDHDLLFVIGGHVHDSFKSNYHLNSSVRFVGFVDENDLATLYKESLACYFASFYEGFGFPILEAMTEQTVVITSNTSSMPEIAGGAAILVDPKDINSMVEGIEKVAHMPILEREKLIKEGKKNVDNFSWRKCAEEMLNQYKIVANKQEIISN